MGLRIALGMLLIAMASFANEPEALRTIGKGAFSAIQEPAQIVVTNQTQWVQLWEKHNARKEPRSAPPEIDFEKESVIFVSLGRKNTGGYGVEITGVKRSEGKTEISVQTREPKPGGFNIQALTAPFHIVAVSRIKGEAQFRTGKKGA